MVSNGGIDYINGLDGDAEAIGNGKHHQESLMVLDDEFGWLSMNNDDGLTMQQWLMMLHDDSYVDESNG